MKENHRNRMELLHDLEAIRRWLFVVRMDALRFRLNTIELAINDITQAIADLQRKDRGNI